MSHEGKERALFSLRRENGGINHNKKDEPGDLY
jgi:hypothetical protein